MKRRQIDKPTMGTRAMLGKLSSVHHRGGCSGQALTESAVAMSMILAFTIGAVMLLLDSAISVFYKQKLAFISNQAAQFACTLPASVDAQSATMDFLNGFMPRLGIKPKNLAVQIDKSVVIAGKSGVIATVSNDCNLFGSASILPLFLRMTDTGMATVATTAVAAAGPPGPPGPAGPQGPQGPLTARIYDPTALRRALNIGGTLTMRDMFGHTVTMPIAGSDVVFDIYAQHQFVH